MNNILLKKLGIKESVELDEDKFKYKKEHDWMVKQIATLKKKKNLSKKEQDKLFKYGKELGWLKKKLVRN